MRNRQTVAKALKRRNTLSRALEPLESHLMLAITPLDIRNTPTPTTPTTTNVADTKNGPMANAGTSLINLYRDYRKFRSSGGTDSQYEANDQLNGLMILDGSRVGVTVRFRGSLDAATKKLRDLNSEILYRTNKYSAIDAFVPVTMLHELAVDPTIATIVPLSPSKTNSVGSANNQADEGHKADLVRSTYGLDGSGVKVGVLSDSVNRVGNGVSGSVATGDLPSDGVTIIQDGGPLFFPEDEGRAMSELIHDIAPGASHGFAAGLNVGQQIFADNVRALRAWGADVIVDDIGVFREPYFQPGVIDQAISDVVNDGAVYLSAAGNENNSGYEAATSFTKVGRNTYVDFDPDSAVSTRLRITFPQNFGGFSQLFMQWDNPYNGVAGSVTTDLDVYIYDPVHTNRILASGTENNLKTGVPVEALSIPLRTIDLEIRVADRTQGTVLPTRFKFYIPDADAITTPYPENEAAIIGHAGGQHTISVGAVPFENAPPTADAGNAIDSEPFSSVGPVTQIFDANGNRLATPRTIQKPDISGLDNTNTSFFADDSFADDDVLPNFTGTSAAAPNVAAIVALIKQAAPSATQEEIRSALVSTADPTNNTPIGQYDPKGGFGLVDGLAAIEQFVKAPTVKIDAVNPDPITTSVDQIKIVFNQQISNFDVSDLTLTLDGGPNLLTGLNGPFTTDGGRSWKVTNLAALTTDSGTYTLTLLDASGIVNPTGLSLVGGASETWVKAPEPDAPTEPTALKAKVVSDTAVRLRWSDNSSEEDGFTIERSENAAFTLKVKSATVGANTTVFTDDKVLPAGRTLYYRVRAFNDVSGFSSFSNIASVVTLSPGEVILDNESSSRVTVSGTWNTRSGAGTYGASFLDDGNSGKGSKSVKYAPSFEFEDDYFVYLRWTRAGDRATNVPVDITFADGGRKTLTIDQRNTGGNGWVLLGKFHFNQGTGGAVTIRTTGTDGRVIADAVRFLSAEGGSPVSPTE